MVLVLFVIKKNSVYYHSTLDIWNDMQIKYGTGNPRVTPEVTRDVCLLARMMAANLYYSQIEDLMFEVIHSSGILLK